VQAQVSPPAYVSIRQHTAYVSAVQAQVSPPAYVSIRQRSAGKSIAACICQHTAYVSGLQAQVSPPAYVSIQHTSADCRHKYRRLHIRQHTAYSIRQGSAGTIIGTCSIQHTPLCVSIRQNTSAYVSKRQHTVGRHKSRIHIYFYIACKSQASSAGKKATSTSENVLPRKNGPYKRTSASVYVLLYQ
jgi:hypothetical protein